MSQAPRRLFYITAATDDKPTAGWSGRDSETWDASRAPTDTDHPPIQPAPAGRHTAATTSGRLGGTWGEVLNIEEIRRGSSALG